MATINGNNSSNVLTGTAYADTIKGYGGNDSLYGRAGDDQIWGGVGDDFIAGEDGNDVLRGEDGADRIYGANGNDVLWGGFGNDSLYGENGTDTLKGEGGNDVLKGGTGLLYAYGGDNDDTLVYGPTTDNLSKLGQYLSGSILNGDAGTDTLQIFNDAKYTQGTTVKPAETMIYTLSDGTMNLSFREDDAAWNGLSSKVGTARGIEKVTVTGSGGLTYQSDYYGTVGKDITGTTGHDDFISYAARDIMRGGGGNDTFHLGGGSDTVYSESTDADTFYFNGSYSGGTSRTIVYGFNGQGSLSGDKIYIDDSLIVNPDAQIKEVNGETVFSLTFSDVYVVKATGLVEGVDWFLI